MTPSTLAVIIAGLAMLAALVGYFSRLRAKNQGFGPNSIKALGTILFIPTILILAVATPFHSEALAALLGTLAGYLLSRGTDRDD
jgi:hypothetical protein